MNKFTNHIQQCVIDFDYKKVIAIFEDVEDAEFYIQEVLEHHDIVASEQPLPTLGICHVDKLSDWSFLR